MAERPTDDELTRICQTLEKHGVKCDPVLQLRDYANAVTAERDASVAERAKWESAFHGKVGRIQELQAELTQTYQLLNNANRLVEDSTARADNAEHNLGNLLARIFGDGGHHQAAIQNDELATSQADAVICETRRLLDKAQFDLATQTARADELHAALESAPEPETGPVAYAQDSPGGEVYDVEGPFDRGYAAWYDGVRAKALVAATADPTFWSSIEAVAKAQQQIPQELRDLSGVAKQPFSPTSKADSEKPRCVLYSLGDLQDLADATSDSKAFWDAVHKRAAEVRKDRSWQRGAVDPQGAEMSEARGRVIKDIHEERRRQDAQWGGPEHDDGHSSIEFALHVQRQVDNARDELTYGPDTDYGRSRFVKIAALAVAAIERIDRLTESEKKQ